MASSVIKYGVQLLGLYLLKQRESTTKQETIHSNNMYRGICLLLASSKLLLNLLNPQNLLFNCEIQIKLQFPIFDNTSIIQLRKYNNDLCSMNIRVLQCRLYPLTVSVNIRCGRPREQAGQLDTHAIVHKFNICGPDNRSHLEENNPILLSCWYATVITSS